MITSSNLARANLQNVLDTPFYIYLNPELEHVHSITSVEDAYMFYLKNRVPYDTSNLVTNPAHVPDRNEFLRNFDHTVYYTMYSSNINEDDYITDDVRESISNDVERLSVIHYHRVGRGDYNYRFASVDSNFNPYMYKVMHGITREMTLPEVYNDYLTRKYVDNQPVVIGDINELTFFIASNISGSMDNLVINHNLLVKETATVEKNANIKGNLQLAPDATLTIDGGTLVISDDFATIPTQDNFVSSNLILGESSMRYVNAATAPGDNPGLILDRADMVVNSNLFVKQNGVFQKSVLIGEDLFHDDAYSMQCEKKIRVEGTDVLSDHRLKKNVVAVDTTKCLEDMMRLVVKQFDLTKHGNATSAPVTGLVAQDVELVLPDTVSAIKGTVPLPVSVKGLTTNPSVLTIQEGAEEDLVRMGISQGTSIQVKRVSTSHVHKYVVEKVAFPNIHLRGTVDLETNETYNIEEVLVDNLRSIDYTQLFCTLLGAVQEIAKEQAKLSSSN